MASPWYSSSFVTRTHSGRSSLTLPGPAGYSLNGSARGTPPYNATRNNSIDSSVFHPNAEAGNANIQQKSNNAAAAANNAPVLPPIKSFPKNVLIEKRLQKLRNQVEPTNSASYTNSYLTQINRRNNVDGGTNLNPAQRSQGRNPIPDFPFVG